MGVSDGRTVIITGADRGIGREHALLCAADAAGAQRLIDSTVERFGGLDVSMNNAGILRDRALVKMTDDDWDDVVRVHLVGAEAARFADVEFALGRPY